MHIYKLKVSVSLELVVEKKHLNKLKRRRNQEKKKRNEVYFDVQGSF